MGGTVERGLACEADSVGTVERCLACEAVVNHTDDGARLLVCCALLCEQTNIAT
jgi:hypothetical protein